MNSYLSREEKEHFIRATALVTQIQETIENYAGRKSTDPEFLKYLRMGRTMLSKAMEMRSAALDRDEQKEFFRQTERLELIFVPKAEAKKAYAELVALKTTIPMELADFEEWYSCVIEVTCKTCTFENYAACPIRKILTKYGVFPIDPEAKDKCQYCYVGTDQIDKPEPVAGVATVPVEQYNVAVAEYKLLQKKVAALSQDYDARFAADFEKAIQQCVENGCCPECGDSESHKKDCTVGEQERIIVKEYENQIERLNKKVEDISEQLIIAKKAAAAAPVPQPVPEVTSNKKLLPVTLGLTSGNKLSLELPEIFARNLLSEIQRTSRSARAICSHQVGGERITVDMQEIVTLQATGLVDAPKPQPKPLIKPQQVEVSQETLCSDGRERYSVECKCGAEYFCSMNAGRFRANCRDCGAPLFADRARGPVDVDGYPSTMLTNTYFVEQPWPQGPKPETRAQAKPVTRRDDGKYADPCDPFAEKGA